MHLDHFGPFFLTGDTPPGTCRGKSAPQGEWNDYSSCRAPSGTEVSLVPSSPDKALELRQPTSGSHEDATGCDCLDLNSCLPLPVLRKELSIQDYRLEACVGAFPETDGFLIRIIKALDFTVQTEVILLFSPCSVNLLAV